MVSQIIPPQIKNIHSHWWNQLFGILNIETLSKVLLIHFLEPICSANHLYGVSQREAVIKQAVRIPQAERLQVADKTNHHNVLFITSELFSARPQHDTDTPDTQTRMHRHAWPSNRTAAQILFLNPAHFFVITAVVKFGTVFTFFPSTDW